MSGSSKLNFDDLPEEVLSLSLDLLTPAERALVSPACQKWHQLIMGTQGWWRWLEVPKSSSMEKTRTMIQFFNSRSANTLVDVKIKRFVDAEEDLEEIFSLIQPSANSLRRLSILGESDLNTLARQLSQSLPKLQSLRCLRHETMGERTICTASETSTSASALRIFATDELRDIQDQDLKWLSELQYLHITLMNSRREAWSILNSCSESLVELSLFFIQIWDQAEDQAFSPNSITFRSLKRLALDITRTPIGHSAGSLPIEAPILQMLTCKASQKAAVEAKALRGLTLVLEDEIKVGLDGTEENWDEERSQRFTEELREGFRQLSSVGILSIKLFNRCPIQLQRLLQLLLYPKATEEEEILLPDLMAMEFPATNQDSILENLARLAISRERGNQDHFFIVRLEHDDLEFGNDIDRKYMEIKASLEKRSPEP